MRQENYNNIKSKQSNELSSCKDTDTTLSVKLGVVAVLVVVSVVFACHINVN